jgi:hypothetical protein
MAVLFFLFIFVSLAAAVYYFRRGESRRLAGALTLRVALSVLFFLLLLLGWYAGWLRPHGLGG